ncbi:MAG: Holliday junction resolvase RusA-like endonuclease [Paracoccaceae bacterium]|jgi:Holliday junction resolvase RusA-like endonuclease
MSTFRPPITFTMPGAPKGWERAGKNGATHFTRSEHQAQMDAIAWRARSARVAEITGPVRLDVVAVFGMPSSWLHNRVMKMRGCPVVKAPDFDNLAKLVADALEPIAYKRDAQISIGTTVKIWGLTPRTIISLTPIQDDEPVDLPWLEGVEP